MNKAMKLLTITLSLLLFAIPSTAQKTVADLQPAHAAALQKYLTAHKNVGFLQEYAFDEESLAYMRKHGRRGMKPYYLTGDFNWDRVTDFAMLLGREGKPKFADPEEAETRKDDVNLRLVVFNGIRKGGYTLAHYEDLEVPLTCFIDLEKGRKPKLYFAVFESDADTFALAPAGKGYIMEFEKPR